MPSPGRKQRSKAARLLCGALLCGLAVPAPAMAAPGLGVALTAAPQRPAVGQPLTYVVALASVGDKAADTVTVTLGVPAGADPHSARPTHGSCVVARVTSCALGSLSAGTVGSVAITVLPVAPGPLAVTATVSSSAGTHTAGAMTTVRLLGGRCTNRRLGTPLADRLVGTVGGDAIFGRAGADTIRGGKGNDCVHGRAGNDKLRGGAGRDLVEGGAGEDELKGGGQRLDRLRGGDGDDELSGGAIASGGNGDDVIFVPPGGFARCGPGRDVAHVDGIGRPERLLSCERVVAPAAGGLPPGAPRGRFRGRRRAGGILQPRGRRCNRRRRRCRIGGTPASARSPLAARGEPAAGAPRPR